MKAVRTITNFYLSRAKVSLQLSSNLTRWSLRRAGENGAVSISTRRLTVDNVPPQSHTVEKQNGHETSDRQVKMEESDDNNEDILNNRDLSLSQRFYNWMHQEIDDCDIVAPYCQHFVASVDHRNDE